MKVFRALFLAVMVGLLSFPLESLAAAKKVIIGFHHKPETSEHNLVYGVKGHIRRAHRHIPAISAEIPEEEIARLKADPSVAYVVEDIKLKLIQPVQPLSIPSPEYANSWGVQRIGSESAAARGFKGAGVKVAIIDSGIDSNHPDLKDNYRGGYNFADNNSDTFDDDPISHGTHVAGIIAARDNGTGVVGVAPEASLYAVKVFGLNSGGEMSTIVAGIEWAIENRMDVINMSVGIDAEIVNRSPDQFKPLLDACDKAYKAGIVIVAAAGNNGWETVAVPAAYNSVIAVSATDQNDQRAVFSPYLSSNYGSKIELAAPGKDIKSTVKGGGYAYLSGTSQAGPHVAGAAAVVIGAGIRDTDMDGSRADEVRLVLDATAKDLGDPGRDKIFGYGLVDVASSAGVTDARLVKLTRTNGLPKNDAVKIQLAKGTYTVIVNNNGLQKITAMMSVGGSRFKAEAFSYDFSKGQPSQIKFEISFSNSDVTLNMVPYGTSGSSVEIIFLKRSI